MKISFDQQNFAGPPKHFGFSETFTSVETEVIQIKEIE